MKANNCIRYEFGSFCLDTYEQRLLRDNELVPLPPKVMDTLTELLKHSGHVLTKDELLTAIWGDIFVEESSLTRNISLLRKALREDQGEKYIETVPKRGYRFVAPVRIIAAPTSHEEELIGSKELLDCGFQTNYPGNQVVPAVTATSQKRYLILGGLILAMLFSVIGGYFGRRWIRKPSSQFVSNYALPNSLAVLPFKVVGQGEDSAFLGLGMADAIIMRLGTSRDCQVRPTSAISKYASFDFDAFKVGKELGVDAVLDGTVQRVGDQVRVTAILWDLKDGHQIWSGKFDDRFGDIFVMQDSISAQVADRLSLNVEHTSPTARFTKNVEAYRHYSMGYYFWSKSDKPNLAKAINYFNQAVQEDPNYGLAYASLADSYLLDAYNGYENVSLQEAYDKAKDAAARAMELDSSLPEANIASGMVKDFEGDLNAAENHFRKAIELNPSSPIARLRYSHVLALTSRLDEAISELQIAEKFDPASSKLSGALGGYLLLAGKYDESIKYSRLALELNPQSYGARKNLAWAYMGKEMYSEALSELTELQHVPGACPFDQTGIAYLAARKGELQEARELIDQTRKSFDKGNPPYDTSLQIAKVLCLLGEREEALSWIQRALESGRLQAYELEYSVDLKPLKSDTRFARLLEEVRNVRPPVNGRPS